MRRLNWLLALTACTTWSVSVARAQTETGVALAGGTGAAPASVREQALAVVADALRERGIVVLTARDASLRMVGQPFRACAAIDCAVDVNRFLGTSFAIITDLSWARGQATLVNVAVVGSDDGESVGGQAEVHGGDVGAAVRTAFQGAWDRHVAAQQGHLVVTTEPTGGFVEVDGVSIGRAPLRRLTGAGAHTVHVTLEGHRSQTREVTIERHQERALEFVMTPGSGPESGIVAGPEPVVAPPAASTTDAPHWANHVLAGTLVAAGALMLVPPLWTAATAGQTVSAAAGDAGEEYVAFGAVSGTLLGLALASIAGGAVVWALLPIRTQVETTPQGASLRLMGEF